MPLLMSFDDGNDDNDHDCVMKTMAVMNGLKMLIRGWR